MTPLNVFISCAHNKPDRDLLDELLKHLAPLQLTDNPLIKTWDDSDILPGETWDDDIKQNLQEADIVLLLVSADFNNSRYIQEVELKEAIERHRHRECRVVPLYMRSCDFKGMPYESLEMLPKSPRTQQSEAVTNKDHWQDHDLAFTEIIKRLRDLIEEIRRQNLIRPDPVPAVVRRKLEDPWHTFFQIYPPKKALTRLDSVNCDRYEHYQAQLERHFENNKTKPGNLLYLITACGTQNPASLAKRLAYWFDEDIALFFTPTDEKRKDEVDFLEWPLEKKALNTWGKFWELFQDNILHAKTDFEDFIKDPGAFLTIPDGTRVLLTFQIYQNDLLEYKSHAHVRYMLEQFAQLPADFQKFVFVFTFHFPDVHYPQIREARQHLLTLLDDFVNPPEAPPGWPAGLHLPCLPPVPENDLKSWCEPRFKDTHFWHISSELKTRVEPDKRDACLQKALFDMRTVEAMQYAAYTFQRDHF